MDVDAARRRLEQGLADVLSQHTPISAHRRNADGDVPIDWSEMARLMETDEVLEALNPRTRVRADEIMRAVGRIEDGTYTICAACGGEISAECLSRLPTAAVCAACG